jgi:hypothetical protein
MAAEFIIKFVDDFFTINFILGESTQRQKSSLVDMLLAA